jgi:beta-lactamase superfamily II metal-dependent hydrolase
MLRFSSFLFIALLMPLCSVLRAADTLDVYVIDVEGGKAMLVITPSGQSMLLDGGMPTQDNRDLNRVVKAAQAAGVKEFDYILTTHYDVDHAGNIPAIAAQIPAKVFVDHGPVVDNPKIAAMNRRAADGYLAFVANQKRMSVKPDDQIPLKDVKVTVLTAGEKTLVKPLNGAGKPNTECPATKPDPVEMDDNSGSIGTLWEFGKFRMADFGDLLHWVDYNLMCPTNRVGSVDLFMVVHHGLAVSNSAELVHGLHPKVAIMNNGERKGAAPDVTKILRSSPGLQDIWQAHYSVSAGPDFNAPEGFIANLRQQDCQAFSIKVSARRDGTFTVTNTRNNFSRTYKP